MFFQKMTNRETFHFDDFTEKSYRKCIRSAKKQGFNFISFSNYRKKGKNCLWRHDIDFSPQRGLSLAKIENQEGIKSTFFIWLHSDFYNPLELEVKQAILDIQNLGHEIGLHFDVGFYEDGIKSIDELNHWLRFEKEILERFLGFPINAFSFHNPIINSNFSCDDEKVEGMINAYSDYLKKNYTYCSDSFCYWRYQRLSEVILDPEVKNLHVLTHPECWSKNVASPYQRILRTFEGRKQKSIEKFLERSKKVGRKIIK